MSINKRLLKATPSLLHQLTKWQLPIGIISLKSMGSLQDDNVLDLLAVAIVTFRRGFLGSPCPFQLDEYLFDMFKCRMSGHWGCRCRRILVLTALGRFSMCETSDLADHLAYRRHIFTSCRRRRDFGEYIT